MDPAHCANETDMDCQVLCDLYFSSGTPGTTLAPTNLVSRLFVMGCDGTVRSLGLGLGFRSVCWLEWSHMHESGLG